MGHRIHDGDRTGRMYVAGNVSALANEEERGKESLSSAILLVTAVSPGVPIRTNYP